LPGNGNLAFIARWSNAGMGKKKDNAGSKETAALNDIAAAIKNDFPHLTDDDVAAMIDRAREDFYNRPIREFVPLFVERRIRSQLTNQKEQKPS
jgi:hypothetical protein